MEIVQDGKPVAATRVTGPLAEQIEAITAVRNIQWGQGVYGPFRGRLISGAGE
jgi:hypothetical protein